MDWRTNKRFFALFLAIAMVATVSATSAGAQSQGNTLTIRTRGETGTEQMQVRVGDTAVAEFGATTSWQNVDVTIPVGVTLNDVAVGFINNGKSPQDRNAFVDWVQLGDERREAESAEVWSTGKWTSATGCTTGSSNGEALLCAGFFHFGGKPDGSTIVAHSIGSTGTENIELLIDDVAVATRRVTAIGNVWASGTATSALEFTLPQPVNHERIRIAFTNDGLFEGEDRNVRIDQIDVDGTQYLTSDPAIESRGTWRNGARCSQGFFGNAGLACNGWFQLPEGQSVAPPVTAPPVSAPPVTAPPVTAPPVTAPPVSPAPVGPPADLPLSVDVVADGLTNPWGMAFLPTGELLFTERLGRLNILTDSGVSRVSADFSNLGQRTSGLLGLALDRDFETNRRFYTCQGQNSPLRQQIVAWELSLGMTSATKVGTLVDAARTGGHSGCRLGVDDDGFLWATFGDDFTASTPQDPNSLHGKVLRIDPQTGAGHPDNLGAGVARDARIYSLGHRNAQGLDFHPTTGQAWIVDHGPDRDDEINALSVGGNFGWNPVGPEGPSVYDELGRSPTDLSIPGVISAPWSSGPSTIAPGGIAFLSGEQWGDFDGAIAMTTLKDERLHLVRFDANNELVDVTVPEELDRSQFARLRSARLGPDGALYVTTSNSGFSNDDLRFDSILRITPADSETAPPITQPGPTPSGDARVITVASRGSTATEQLHLEIDGEEVFRWNPTRSTETVSYTHSADVTGSQVRVRFSNDGLHNREDRNVWIDYITIGDQQFESEHPTVRSRGAWLNGARCREGTFNTEFLACNGWFQFANDGGNNATVPIPEPDPTPTPNPTPNPTPGQQQIEVRALGSTGEERLALRIDDEIVETFELSRTMSTYAHTVSESIDGEIQLVFVNDGRTRSGADRNVRVDFIDVDDVVYQTESSSVFSTGTWQRGSGCAPGNKRSEWLHCNGYFEFSIG